MSMFKKIVLNIFYFTLHKPETTNMYQKIARDTEWEALTPYLSKGRFLDIGAGAGYALKKASEDFACDVIGVDPEPNGHGVGRSGSKFDTGFTVLQGFAEALPFPDNEFDIVYSSHVLEHVEDIDKSLSEMKRVLKDGGKIIIGVPTSTMAVLNWFSQALFTTHIKIVNVLFSKIINTDKSKWWEIFISASHSYPNKTILYDIKNYRITNWQKILSKHVKIKKVLLPGLYPYPQYIQLFKLKKNTKFSSSVFFICETQNN